MTDETIKKLETRISQLEDDVGELREFLERSNERAARDLEMIAKVMKLSNEINAEEILTALTTYRK